MMKEEMREAQWDGRVSTVAQTGDDDTSRTEAPVIMTAALLAKLS